MEFAVYTTHHRFFVEGATQTDCIEKIEDVLNRENRRGSTILSVGRLLDAEEIKEIYGDTPN